MTPEFIVPEGLKQWESRIASVLARPFPPPGEEAAAPTPWVKSLTICELACLELLDCEPGPGERAMWHQELRHRGLSNVDIQDLRRFLWLTVGWFNFEMTRNEWVRLDERDVEQAICLQCRQGLIDESTGKAMQSFVKHLISPRS